MACQQSKVLCLSGTKNSITILAVTENVYEQEGVCLFSPEEELLNAASVNVYGMKNVREKLGNHSRWKRQTFEVTVAEAYTVKHWTMQLLIKMTCWGAV